MNQPEKTIPFSLEKWKAGYEVVCRDGTAPSEFHCFSTALQPFKIVAVVGGKLHTFDTRGRVLLSGRAHKFDLFLLPKMEKWYRRVYRDGFFVLRYNVAPTTEDEELQDDYWSGTRAEWVGPIEEFEVMAGEK